MLKTRSLFPHYGKYDLYGYVNGTYISRKPTSGRSFEQELLAYHAAGLAGTARKVGATYMTMGDEKFESSERFYADNWCFHHKTVRTNLPMTLGYRNRSGRYEMYPFRRYEPSNVEYPDKQAVLDAFNAAQAKVGDELRAEAYWDLRPKFEGEVSMLNFLFELKDFRSIAKLFSRRDSGNPIVALSDALQGYNLTAYNNRLKAGFISPFVRPTETLAEAHLVNSFAIKPLISDCSEIFKQLHATVDEAEKKFAETGAGNTRHWSKLLDPVATLWETSGDFTCQTHMGSRLQSRFTATAHQRFVYTPRRRFNKFCTYWGLVPTAESIWNALPFSFLADYFVSIGKSLNRMRTDPNVGDYRLSNYTESLLTSYEGGRFLSTKANVDGRTNMGIVLDDNYHSAVTNVLVDGFSSTYYKRELDVKPYYGPALPSFRWPKSSQLLNMAALARCLL